jgi:hypothetical protein
MNRRERRRRTKLGDIVEIKFGRVVFDIKPGEDTSRDICYVCSKPATAWLVPEGGAGADPRREHGARLCRHQRANRAAVRGLLQCRRADERRNHTQVLECAEFENLREIGRALAVEMTNRQTETA